MSNIYLNVSIKKKVHSQNFQLTQILLNFETSCYNLKIRGSEEKLYVAFLLF